MDYRTSPSWDALIGPEVTWCARKNAVSDHEVGDLGPYSNNKARELAGARVLNRFNLPRQSV